MQGGRVGMLGHLQSRESIEEVIRFAAEERLFLLADEVYQSCVYGDNAEFYSYKKVLSEMGSNISSTVELASFNSASKGFMGECGFRGGYVELLNLDPAVMKYARTLFSTRSCPPVAGQIALDLMADPPKPGDPSFPTFSEVEKTDGTRHAVLFAFARGNGSALKRAVKTDRERLTIISCARPTVFCTALMWMGYCTQNPSKGLHRQCKFVNYSQLFVGTQENIMEDALQRLKTFHTRFMKEFS
ncbi:hypothetical protein QQF64_014327 [Cirrhinus molitorella]|uniref:alanine transaminase n=1 Tax=Cirrhinus molitorella TaxID=172907 RepID=A0ABR3NS88_9TELE